MSRSSTCTCICICGCGKGEQWGSWLTACAPAEPGMLVGMGRRRLDTAGLLLYTSSERCLLIGLNVSAPAEGGHCWLRSPPCAACA